VTQSHRGMNPSFFVRASHEGTEVGPPVEAARLLESVNVPDLAFSPS